MRRERNGKFRLCVLPGYNWCGPGCSGPGAPINEVDRVCKAHDLCYKSGKSKCACDREFIRRLEPKVNPYTQEGRHARTLCRYMKLQTMYTCNSRHYKGI